MAPALPSWRAAWVLAESRRVGTGALWSIRSELARTVLGAAGAYVVAFKVKARPKAVLKGQRLGVTEPLAKAHQFPGIDGAVKPATGV